MALECRSFPAEMGSSCLVPFFHVTPFNIPYVKFCANNIVFGDKSCQFGTIITCNLNNQSRSFVYFFSTFSYKNNKVSLVVCETDNDDNIIDHDKMYNISHDQLQSISDKVLRIQGQQRQQIMRDAAKHVFNNVSEAFDRVSLLVLLYIAYFV
jgi:hypothetical protein